MSDKKIVIKERNLLPIWNKKKKSRILETPNLLTDADSSIDIFVSAGVEKGADSNVLDHVISGPICIQWRKHTDRQTDRQTDMKLYN